MIWKFQSASWIFLDWSPKSQKPTQKSKMKFKSFLSLLQHLVTRSIAFTSRVCRPGSRFDRLQYFCGFPATRTSLLQRNSGVSEERIELCRGRTDGNETKESFLSLHRNLGTDCLYLFQRYLSLQWHSLFFRCERTSRRTSIYLYFVIKYARSALSLATARSFQ